MNSIATRIFKLSPLQLGLCFFLLPFFALILQGLLTLNYIFTGSETLFPIFDLSILFIHLIFFVWIWTISVTINKQQLQIKNTLFKISFFLYVFHRVFSFIMALELDIMKNTGWYVENSTIILIDTLMIVYGLIVFVAFIYCCVFTGTIVAKLIANQPKRTIDQIPRSFLIIVFLLGIPLLQSRIQQYLSNQKFPGFTQKKRPIKRPIPSKPQPAPKAPEAPKETPKSQEQIDKEDPRRFMPK
jgi:hypothetical protein